LELEKKNKYRKDKSLILSARLSEETFSINFHDIRKDQGKCLIIFKRRSQHLTNYLRTLVGQKLMKIDKNIRKAIISAEKLEK